MYLVGGEIDFILLLYALILTALIILLFMIRETLLLPPLKREQGEALE